ncbi:MAG: hypothetical protein LUG25_07850 [Oscillospiraceae bacterium]|nr:hypothetical protein [Oscillospiraceae bacterium]
MSNKISAQSEKTQMYPALFFLLFLAAIAVCACIANLLTGGMFLEVSNAKAIFCNCIYPCFVAWALCFMFACGYTDLSLGGVVVLGSFAACACGNAWGYPGLLIGSLVVGTLLVFFNFFIFAFTKIPSWIASISLAMIYEAIAVFLRANTGTRTYFAAELNRSLRGLALWPTNLIVLIIALLIIYVLYNRTGLGMNARAIGGNADVSKVLGININRTLLCIGLLCGILVGFASAIQESYNVLTTAMSGLVSLQMIYKPLAIALLAQVLQKRINIILAVPFCALIIYGIFNLMTFFGVPSGTLQDLVLGAFLILFGAIGQKGTKEVVK